MARLEIAAFVAFLPPCLPGGELNVPLLDVGQLLLEGEHLKTGGGVGAGRGGRCGPAHPQEGEVRGAVAAGAKVIRQTLSRLKINERSVMTGSFSGFGALLASTACASMMSVLVLDASSLCALASTPTWSSLASLPCSGSRSPSCSSSSSGSSSSTIFSTSLNSNWWDSSAMTEWSSTSRSSYLSNETNLLDSMYAPQYSKVLFVLVVLVIPAREAIQLVVPLLGQPELLHLHPVHPVLEEVPRAAHLLQLRGQLVDLLPQRSEAHVVDVDGSGGLKASESCGLVAG